jgi:hypothetical protein
MNVECRIKKFMCLYIKEVDVDKPGTVCRRLRKQKSLRTFKQSLEHKHPKESQMQLQL